MIRRRVREEVALTCSCGIGPNRLLAKVASDIRKPDGQFAIPGNSTAITRFIDLLPIRKVPGIGKACGHLYPLLLPDTLPVQCDLQGFWTSGDCLHLS